MLGTCVKIFLGIAIQLSPHFWELFRTDIFI